MRLLATTATLVVHDDLHPALVNLLAAAAVEVHGAGGLFERHGDFPSTKGADFPVSRDAERYYKSGAPSLQRFLPFWAAVFVDRMVMLFLPVIALMIPLLRVLPPLYQWRVSSCVYRYYGRLRFLEDEVERNLDRSKVGEYLAQLDEIESQINHLSIPLAFNNLAYTLRQHIYLVRTRIGRLGDPQTQGAAPERGGASAAGTHEMSAADTPATPSARVISAAIPPANKA
jgi:hypothetical protein